jgi:hypothetical protein
MTMKSNRLFGFALIVCTIFLTFVPCHAQQYSPQYQALLKQIQQNYLSPKGENISVLRSQYPAVVATLVGHALRQQRVHVQQNPSLNNQFINLQREAQVYIGEVARTTSARLDDGSRPTQQDLWTIVNRAYQGQDDDWIWQNFRVRTGTMPSVMAAGPGVQPSRPPVWDPPMKEEEKSQIDLLGQGAPSVKGPDSCENVALYFSPQCEWYRKQKEAQVKAETQKSKALNPDGIVGNWSFQENKQLKIWKQGDQYLGSVNGPIDGLVPNVVCLRLKYAGAGKDGPVYKGQYYLSSGAAGNIYSWQEVSFYYYLSWGKEVFSAAPSGSASIKRFVRP